MLAEAFLAGFLNAELVDTAERNLLHAVLFVDMEGDGEEGVRTPVAIKQKRTEIIFFLIIAPPHNWIFIPTSSMPEKGGWSIGLGKKQKRGWT